MARQIPAEVELTGDWDQQTYVWKRFREKENHKTKTIDDSVTKKLSSHALKIQENIRKDLDIALDLPVFGYYGTGRLWSQKKLRDAESLSENEEKDLAIRTFAYRNCMDPASSYKHFRAWFINAWESKSNMLSRSSATDKEIQIADDRIKVVQGVIDVFLKETTGWHTLEYSVEDQKSLILSHEKHGRMNVDYLSDGIRSMLAMVGDIAYRCIKLNQHLGQKAAICTDGIVLIDEVDMHLHPRWQQLILAQLQKAFPKIQFIVTTHSPQVLTTVSSDCIRILRDNKVYGAPAGTEGAEPQRLLQDVLGVENIRPPHNIATQELQEYLSFIDNEDWENPRALELRKTLDERYQGNEPALLNADLIIDNLIWESDK